MIKLQNKNKAITGYVILFIWLFSFNPTIHAQPTLFSLPKKIKTQSTFSNRYVILIDGINSSSSGSSPLNGDFEVIENELIKAGISNSNIVYFSYSAVTKDKYCLGWRDACSATSDLSYLYLFPVYGKGNTHLKISDQTKVLEWLIEQIIKKDSNAQIDIIGFSQGGIIAAYWGSHTGKSSPHRSKIHGIITLESPLGGIPMAEQCVGSLTLPICPFLRLHYGDELLRVLQMPGSLPDSIVDELPDVSSYFSFTSIQSSTDYTVNGISFPIDWTIHGHQDALIGNGSQSWVSSKQLLLMNKPLGGNGFPDSDQSILEAISWITENHFAPLKNQQTIDWIIEIINAPPHNNYPEPGEPESDFWEKLMKNFQNWWQNQLEKIGDDLDTWWQEQKDKVEDTFDQWWQDLQRQLKEWFEQQLINWLNQLCGTAFLPAGAIASVWGMRQFRERKNSNH